MATVTGTANHDSLNGTSSADLISGRAGNDTLTGLGGADTLDGGLGVDSLVGGAGNDTYYVDMTVDADGPGMDRWDEVVEMPGEGTDTVVITTTTQDWGYYLAGDVENFTIISTAGIGGYLYANDLANQITGGSGADRVDAGMGNDTINGGDGDDFLIGGSGADSLSGDAGNDNLDGGNDLEADTLAGGDGDDTYMLSIEDSIIEGAGGGIDTVLSWLSSGTAYALPNNIENLIGSGVIYGNGLANYLAVSGSSIYGLGGNDTLMAGRDSSTLSATTTLIGGMGDDTYIVAAGNGGSSPNSSQIVELASEGNDTIVYSVVGGFPNGSSTYSLDHSGNIESLLLANKHAYQDVIQYVNGNAGANSLGGSEGEDHISGGDGNDVMMHMTAFTQTSPNEYVLEILRISTFENRQDYAWVGTGVEQQVSTDTLVGGNGNDIYYIDDQDIVIEDANAGTDTLNVIGESASYTLAVNFENLVVDAQSGFMDLYGNTVANRVVGNNLGNWIEGLGGNDTLVGGRGSDTLVGGAGNDRYEVDSAVDVVLEVDGQGTDTVVSTVTYTLATGSENLVLDGTWAINGYGNMDANSLTGNSARNILDGDEGADTLIGGGGNDKYLVDDAGDTVTETATGGTNDRVFSSVSHTLAVNVETLVLTAGEEIDGTGNTLANTLRGNGMANRLDGGDGNDALFAGSGNDTLLGGKGNDELAGGNGQDSLTGAIGNDSLTGGLGNDVFVFSVAPSATTNLDHVVDFTSGADKLQLNKSVFTAISSDSGTTTLNAASFVNGSAAADAGDRIIYNAASGTLYYDADGTGATAKIAFAVIDTKVALSAGDILVG